MTIKITQEILEAAKQKNQRRRQLSKITISQDRFGNNRSDVLDETVVADAQWKTITIPSPPEPEEPEPPAPELPYVGQEDPYTKDTLTTDDDVVRCQKCGFYHLKSSWETYQRCGNCSSTEYYDISDEDLI